MFSQSKNLRKLPKTTQIQLFYELFYNGFFDWDPRYVEICKYLVNVNFLFENV